jgi:hypothetical protein
VQLAELGRKKVGDLAEGGRRREAFDPGHVVAGRLKDSRVLE